MLKIFKYEIAPSYEPIQIKTYAGAHVLSCGLAPDGFPYVWVMVDDSAPEGTLNVACVGTGWPLEPIFDKYNLRRFIGTIKDDPYMWHVFALEKITRGRFS